jgi:N-acetylneuraminic acid mutarotase
MTTARTALTSSVANNMIYVIGGDIYNSDSGYIYYNTNECYNPTSNTWTTKKNMTTARGGLTSSVVNNMIYVIGGYDYYDTFSLDKNECYNPTSNTWTTKRNMTTGRANVGATVVDDKIYVIGGYRYRISGDDYIGFHSDVNECYNPTSNTWTTKASLPIARDGATLSTVNGKIYVIGGRVDDELNHPVNINRCYNPTSNTWSTKKGMPTTRLGSTASVVDNNIYIIGGWSHSSDLPSNEIYIV